VDNNSPDVDPLESGIEEVLPVTETALGIAVGAVSEVEEIPFDEPEKALELRRRLLGFGIRLDPKYRLTICLNCHATIQFDHAYGHFKDRHPDSMKYGTDRMSGDEVRRNLVALGADRPRVVPLGPIPIIQGISVVPGFKCGILGCPMPQRVFSSIKRHHEHCRDRHPELLPKQRSRIDVRAHRLGMFKGSLYYVEVIPMDVSAQDSSLADIVKQAERLGLYDRKTVYDTPTNARPKGMLLTTTNWERCLVDVDLSLLRPTGFPVNEKTEPAYWRLKQLVRVYYSEIAAKLGTLCTLTLRSIASANRDLVKAPFRKPQERETIERYSDFTSLFLVFLLRHLQNPIPRFRVPLHPQTEQLLLRLLASLKDINTPALSCLVLIHRTLFSLLSLVSEDFTRDESRDLSTLFLVVFHLIDDMGNLTKSSSVPPNISKLQWCFRATGAAETIDRMRECNGNSYEYVLFVYAYLCFNTKLCFSRAYKIFVQDYLIDGKQTLFTGLRQKMALISSLSYSEPGIPRFMWNVSKTVLTVDGFAIQLSTLYHLLRSSIDSMETMIRHVFRGCEFEDILAYIDSRMDPLLPDKWFRDSPQESKQGTSIFSYQSNNLNRFSFRLLEHLAKDPDFFLRFDGQTTVHRGEL
jgi:hypothetical protein